jgi:pyruvate/2-oxoglutarate dehydrogenase complex dihydrolipoamide acyltransferase (E2) component
MTTVEIMLERDTANDESALVVAILAASGTEVAEEDLLFEIENSKATQELRAPRAGILIHELEVGKTVEFGVPIARIVGADRAAADAAAAVPAQPEAKTPAPQTAPAAPAEPAEMHDLQTIFSKDAMRLIEAHGVSPQAFRQSFVTSADVLDLLPGAKKPPAKVLPPVSRPAPAKPAKAGEPLGQRKLAEIDTLSAGAGGTMLSVLGRTLGAVDVKRAPEDAFRGRITDLVLYEASRLMRKYPKLNAAFLPDGSVTLHDRVTAGIAFDSGARLVVYGIEDADRLSLTDLAGAVADAVARYMNNELTAGEMTRATFTVTDLSADQLDFVFPLLPRGQSCILGITHDRACGFRVFAGFDHRVTEGREVASFLGELGDRVLSFAADAQAVPAALACHYCDRTLGDAVAKNRDKGLLSVVDRSGKTVLCCVSCWNGW